jgi:enhancing lycopene biosynthesis protein 2
MKKIAVILCGSGFRDGSEIRESVAVLWALSRHQVEVQCFAPDAPQADVINCLTMKPMNETRNQLIESARIARGKVLALDKLDPAKFDALILPGGFGAAKNLCSYAADGAQGSVRPELKNVIIKMFEAKKPIGAVCIAPAIVGIALKGTPIELTLGATCEDSQEMESLGHKHFVKKTAECHIDKRNKIVTTPAYMNGDSPLHEVFAGIQKLVDEVIALA